MYRQPPKPLKPNDRKYIFTEGIDYRKTGKRSIWGGEDRKTGQFLSRANLKGKWLHLAAGDGRYNLKLLKKVHRLVAADIDKSALSKLWQTTPVKYRRKLKLKPFDLTKKFPFGNKSFDGLFSTSTLHIFPKIIFYKIVSEIDRVLKPGGMIIIDFSTDIQRERFDGKPYVIKGEPRYSYKEAEVVLNKAFKNYDIKMRAGKVPKEFYPKANPPYAFSSQYILMTAVKKL